MFYDKWSSITVISEKFSILINTEQSTFGSGLQALASAPQGSASKINM